MADTGKADAAPAGAAKKVASGKVVQYVGTADIREIDKAGWKNADVEDQGLVRWDAKNKWRVPVEELSDDALVYLDEVDDGFVVKDYPVEK